MGKNDEKAMNICVCGDYYTEEFYRNLIWFPGRVDIISHRETDDVAITSLFHYTHIDNIGLEWGAYDYYLKNVWDKKSDVLFCHDDIQVDSPKVFTQISKLSDSEHDCVFIFQDVADGFQNKGGKKYPSHGRGVFIKASFLHDLLEDGGFKYDETNSIYTIDPTPEGVKDANWAIREFDKTLVELGASVSVAYYPEWYNGCRGKLKREVA